MANIYFKFRVTLTLHNVDRTLDRGERRHRCLIAWLLAAGCVLYCTVLLCGRIASSRSHDLLLLVLDGRKVNISRAISSN